MIKIRDMKKIQNVDPFEDIANMKAEVSIIV